MNIIELQTALRRLRVSGMAATLEGRIREAQAAKWPPIDLVSSLVQDELLRRQDRLVRPLAPGRCLPEVAPGRTGPVHRRATVGTLLSTAHAR